MTRNKAQKQRPFLKWAGGKYEIAEKIREHLPDGKVLIEPFVGAGAIFLNTDYEQYILNDVNPDLINLYLAIQKDGKSFIEDARKLFCKKNNSEEAYYSLRAQFNASTDTYERSIIFLYMNKFGYNGLCRYNRSGEFNVPFGRHKNPTFPQTHIEHFAEKSKKARFICEDFSKTFSRARKGHVIYCDPPYASASATAYFSDYATEGFGDADQERLAHAALHTSKRGIPVIISNHNTPYTRKIYEDAKLIKLSVRRNISCNYSNRKNAPLLKSEWVAI